MGQSSSSTCSSSTRPEPQRGDHIYTDRSMYGLPYFHHGIYVGDDMVIHFLPRQKGESSSSSSSPCGKCGYKQNSDFGIVKTCLGCFRDGHSLFIFEYGEKSKPDLRVFISERLSFSPDEVVKTATNLLQGGGFDEYSLVFNNCESFASYCKTGHATSHQVNLAADILCKTIDAGYRYYKSRKEDDLLSGLRTQEDKLKSELHTSDPFHQFSSQTANKGKVPILVAKDSWPTVPNEWNYPITTNDPWSTDPNKCKDPITGNDPWSTDPNKCKDPITRNDPWSTYPNKWNDPFILNDPWPTNLNNWHDPIIGKDPWSTGSNKWNGSSIWTDGNKWNNKNKFSF